MKIDINKEDCSMLVTFYRNENYVEYLNALNLISSDNHIEDITEEIISHCFYYESEQQKENILNTINNIKEIELKTWRSK